MTRRLDSKVRVLLVDDSAVCRKLSRGMLEGFPDVEIAGEAENPYQAMEMLAKPPRPDVILLDLEMPQMDGLTFLKLMMRTAPIPIVIYSAIAEPNSMALVEALACGAIDVISKSGADGQATLARRLHQAILVAARARLPRPPKRRPQRQPEAVPRAPAGVEVIAIGASTGGPQALQDILRGLGEDLPPTLLVQHMPTAMTPAFVNWLNGLSRFRVVEAVDGAVLSGGTICVGSGDRHLRLERRGDDFVSRLSDEPPRRMHRPSVDVLFESVALAAGGSALGVILSGMGRDGAKGLLAMREAGAYTIAQDEPSCVVFGMPGESARLGAACEVLGLQDIPVRIATISRGDLHHVRT